MNLWCKNNHKLSTALVEGGTNSSSDGCSFYRPTWAQTKCVRVRVCVSRYTKNTTRFSTLAARFWQSFNLSTKIEIRAIVQVYYSKWQSKARSASRRLYGCRFSVSTSSSQPRSRLAFWNLRFTRTRHLQPCCWSVESATEAKSIGVYSKKV